MNSHSKVVWNCMKLHFNSCDWHKKISIADKVNVMSQRYRKVSRYQNVSRSPWHCLFVNNHTKILIHKGKWNKLKNTFEYIRLSYMIYKSFIFSHSDTCIIIYGNLCRNFIMSLFQKMLTRRLFSHSGLWLQYVCTN